MSRLTEVSTRLSNVNEGEFQNICDELLSYYFRSQNRQFSIVRLGTKDGTSKTTKGTPDTYFVKGSGEYIYAEYTTQKSGLVIKIKDDLEKCFQQNIKDKVNCIYYLHNSSNIDSEQNEELTKYCNDHGMELVLWGLDQIAEMICYDFPMIAKEYLHIELDTHQIMEFDQFIQIHDESKVAAPLDTQFISEKDTLEKIIQDFRTKDIVVLSGPAGTGKTRTALEVARFFQNDGCRVLCMKSNGVSVREDFIYYITRPGKYFVVFDDANEFGEIQNILDTARAKKTFQFKFIFTVRDYLKKGLLKKLGEKYLFDEFNISYLNFENITTFLENTLEITDVTTLAYINKASAGNPRMAYMIGQVYLGGSELGKEATNEDVYDQYFSSQIETMNLTKDSGLFQTSVVLAFFRNIRVFQGKSELEISITNILAITSNQMEQYLRKLVDLEIASQPVPGVFRLVDQTLANYLIYYGFVKEQIIDLALFLQTVFPENQQKVEENIFMLCNSFYTKENVSYITQSLKHTAEYFKKNDDKIYEAFLVKFHLFMKEEALLYVNNLLDVIEAAEPVDIDLSEILTLLSGTQIQTLTAIELFGKLWDIDQSKKRWHDKCAKWFIKEFSYNPIGNRINHEKVQTALNWLKQRYEKNREDKDVIKLCVEYLKKILYLEISQIIWVDKSIVISTKNYFNNNPRIESIRKTAWEVLLSINKDHQEYDEDLLSFLREQIKFQEEHSNKLNYSDLPYIAKMLWHIMKQYPVRSACILQEYQKKFPVSDMWSCDTVKEIFGNREYQDYQKIISNYPEYRNWRDKNEQNHKNVLDKVSNLNLAERKNYTDLVNILLTREDFCKSDEWKLKDFVSALWESYCTDEDRVEECLKIITDYEDFKELLAPKIICLVFTRMSSTFQDQFYYLLKDEEWKYQYWVQKTNREVDDIPKVLDFFRSLGKEKNERKSVSGRVIHFLLEYEKLQAGTFVKSIQYLWEARDKVPLVCISFCDSFFRDQDLFSKKDVYDLFQKNKKLLSNMYWYCAQNESFFDPSAEILKKFLQYDQSFWKNSIASFMESTVNEKHISWYSITELWRSPRSVEVFKQIIDSFYVEEMDENNIQKIIKRLLDIYQKDESQMESMHNWFLAFISEHATENEKMKFIFKFICNEPDNSKLEAYETYLQLNPDFELFKQINIERTFYLSSGSQIPVIDEEIYFLWQLKNKLKGLDYLKHRQFLNDMILAMKDNKTKIAAREAMDEG